MDMAGEGKYIRTKEHRKLMSVITKDYWRKHPELIKDRISEMNKAPKTRITSWAKGKKFSREHRKKLGDAHRGEKQWNWKGGITKENKRIRDSLENKFWREDVYKRDNYECQLCGQIGGKLSANHIKKFADYPELRFEIDNGITVCQNCHIGMINHHEEEWESYFKFNLETRSMQYAS